MKTLLSLIVFGFSTILANAQKVDEKEVPSAIKESLKKNFSVIKAEWDKEGENYEGNFKQKGIETSIVFDAKGSVLEVEREIKKNELPSVILDVIKKDYALYEIEEAARIEANGIVTYEAELEKKEESFDLIFDNAGKLLKKVAKEKKEDED